MRGGVASFGSVAFDGDVATRGFVIAADHSFVCCIVASQLYFLPQPCLTS